MAVAVLDPEDWENFKILIMTIFSYASLHTLLAAKLRRAAVVIPLTRLRKSVCPRMVPRVPPCVCSGI